MIIIDYIIINQDLFVKVSYNALCSRMVKVVDIKHTNLLESIICLQFSYENSAFVYTCDFPSKISLIKLEKIFNDIQTDKRKEDNSELPEKLKLLNSVQLCETVGITYYELTKYSDRELYVATGYYKVGRYKKEWLYAKANWVL